MTLASRLLALPAELRHIIWEHTMTSSSGSLVYDSHSRRFDVSSIGAGLISTCHHTSQETKFLPLKLNKLVFDMPRLFSVEHLILLERLNRLEEQLHWVLRMEVLFDDSPVTTWDDYCQCCLGMKWH